MLACVLPHTLGAYFPRPKDGSALSIVEIMYGEIEDGIKEDLNMSDISVAQGHDFSSEKLPVSEKPSLEQEPEGGKHIEVIPLVS